LNPSKTFRIFTDANPPALWPPIRPAKGHRREIPLNSIRGHPASEFNNFTKVIVGREINLLIHFLGFGLLVTINVAGFILNRQYKKAPDLQTKATILRVLRPIGLISPVAILIMLITGIGNMHFLGLGVLDMGWLTAKIIFFAIAAISGVLMGIVARKRGKLVGEMAAGRAPAEAEQALQSYDRQISLAYVVFPILLIIILWLSIYGRLGGQ
jgi:hypothetical protein